MATFSLRAYSTGLVAFMLVKVLAPGFFARQDIATPVRIGVVAMVSNMFLNLLFVLPLHHYWQMGHVGLALATSVSAFLNAGLLFIALRKKAIYLPGSRWPGFMFKLAVAVAAMLVALVLVADYYTALDASLWQQLNWWQRSGTIGIICATGFAVYIAVLWLGVCDSPICAARPRQPVASTDNFLKALFLLKNSLLMAQAGYLSGWG